MPKSFSVTFPNGLTAFATRVHEAEELTAAVSEMGLGGSRPTIVLVGGADGLQQPDHDRLRPWFVGALAPLVQNLSACIVDGGTDTGVMRLMGRARADAKGDFPLIGVAAIGTISLPGNSPPTPGATPLEPYHTHFLLVPGDRWGDESPWLNRTAKVLANNAPSVTILVDGGETTLQDLLQSVRARRPVIVVGGSGRLADTLAGALAGEEVDGRAKQLVASGLLRPVSLSDRPGKLTKAIEEVLFGG